MLYCAAYMQPQTQAQEDQKLEEPIQLLTTGIYSGEEGLSQEHTGAYLVFASGSTQAWSQHDKVLWAQ